MSGEPGDAPAVHQFVPALIPRDATGTHTLLLRDALRRAGWRSEIFTEATHDELAAETFDVTGYPGMARPGDVLVYQFSTSSMVADFLATRPEPLVLDYHNVTDPELYGPWDPVAADRSARALAQLARLAPRSALGIAVSDYNRVDLEAAGCPRTAVAPVLVDLSRLAGPPDPRVLAHLEGLKAEGGADLLFVGRVVPPKAQHRLVAALWAYRRLYDPAARLHLVGPAPSGRYLAALRHYVAELGLEGAVRLSGEVSDGALAAHYAAADAYVSLSRHEGFGVPIVEALRGGLPVVALAAGAVPDTLGGAGILLDTDQPALVAAAVDRVVKDPRLGRALADAGRARVSAYSLEECGRAAVEALATVAGVPPARRAAVR